MGDLPINNGYVYVGVRPAEEKVQATLTIHFVGRFGEDINVEPITLTKEGKEGEWARFEYGKDWTLPEGYEFAEEFDEITAKQVFEVKYGDTSDIPEIGIVPSK